MNTDLSDAEWALVSDLCQRDRQRRAPARYERRHMINACCCPLRKGFCVATVGQDLAALAGKLQVLQPLGC